MAEQKPLIVIGRREKVDFPKLGLTSIEAKVDTGAYSSALHCKEVSVKTVDGKKRLSFIPLDESYSDYNGNEVLIKKFAIRKIKNSFGEFERRYVIRTTIVLAGKRIITDITLSDRGKMKYPVLIGRKMLRKKFIIDVSRVNIAGNESHTKETL